MKIKLKALFIIPAIIAISLLLVIPGKSDWNLQYYTISKGDSLWKISGDQLGDPNLYKFIAVLNPDMNPDQLRVGQKILIPKDLKIARHEVKAGESLADIAGHYLGSPDLSDVIAQFNGLENEELKPGGFIRVPYSEKISGLSSEPVSIETMAPVPAVAEKKPEPAVEHEKEIVQPVIKADADAGREEEKTASVTGTEEETETADPSEDIITDEDRILPEAVRKAIQREKYQAAQAGPEFEQAQEESPTRQVTEVIPTPGVVPNVQPEGVEDEMPLPSEKPVLKLDDPEVRFDPPPRDSAVKGTESESVSISPEPADSNAADQAAPALPSEEPAFEKEIPNDTRQVTVLTGSSTMTVPESWSGSAVIAAPEAVTGSAGLAAVPLTGSAVITGQAPLTGSARMEEKDEPKKGRSLKRKKVRKSGINIGLPFESDLNVTGRKSIKIKFGRTFRPVSDSTLKNSPAPGVSDGLDIEQTFWVKVKGTIMRKTEVNIDYDDTKEDKRDISIIYTGDEGEFIQKAAFGDIRLDLPRTEFVNYNKNLFGARVEAEWRDLNLVAIGSRTKGETKRKEFTGTSSLETDEIKDTSYRQLRYFRLRKPGLDENYKILSGTEKIYLDDRQSGNNSYNINFTAANTTGVFNDPAVTGSYEILVSGYDYAINYSTGEIVFQRGIANSYVVAIAFRSEDGSSYGYTVGGELDPFNNPPLIIKNQENTDYRYEYELRTYYKFQNRNIDRDSLKIRIRDREDSEVNGDGIPYIEAFGLDEDADDRVENKFIDYEFGLLRIPNEFPDPNPETAINETYLYNNDPVNVYTIQAEYERRVNEFSVNEAVVKNSENITLDGRLLQRDVDYLIDYQVGFINLLTDQDLDETSKIVVNYESAREFGGGEENLFGIRGEYKVNEQLDIGSTVLYQAGTGGGGDVDVISAPQSLTVFDIDFTYDSKMTLPFNIPFDYDIKGEFAKSMLNPNTDGKATVDDMEGSLIVDSTPSDEDLWRFENAGVPSDPFIRLENRFPMQDNISSDDNFIGSADTGHKDTSVEIQRSLRIDYDLPALSGGTESSWTGSTYILSRTGRDFSERESLDVWVGQLPENWENSQLIMHIDLGTINEDVDNDGILDTEDNDNNGILNVGEDNGIDVNIGTETVTIGAGNDKLDTEDLDNDGFLSTEFSYYQFSFPLRLSDIPAELISENESNEGRDYYKITFPLPEDGFIAYPDSIRTRTTGDTPDLDFVKHLRIWFENPGPEDQSGQLLIDALEITGFRWLPFDGDPIDPSKFTIGTVNDGVGGRKSKEEVVERSLVMVYENLVPGEQGFVKREFGQAQDFSSYSNIEVYLDSQNYEEEFIMRFGSGVEDNLNGSYYELRIPLNFSGGFRKFSISLEDTDGDMIPDGLTIPADEMTPSLENIKELAIGIGNFTGGTSLGRKSVLVDQIQLTGAKTRGGTAKKLETTGTWPEVVSFTTRWREKTQDFAAIGQAEVSQKTTSTSFQARWNYVDFMPITFQMDKTETGARRNTFGTVKESERNASERDAQSVNLRFNYGSFPRVNLSVSNSNNINISSLKETETTIYTAGMNYEFPQKVWFLKWDRLFLDTKYVRKAEERIEEKENLYSIESRLKDVKRTYRVQYQGMNKQLKIDPSFNDTHIYNIERLAQKRQNTELNLSYKEIKGFTPRINMSSEYSRVYDGGSANWTGKFGVSSAFVPAEWFPAPKKLNFNIDYSINSKGIFPSVPSDTGMYSVMSKVKNRAGRNPLLYFIDGDGFDDTVSDETTASSNNRIDETRSLAVSSRYPLFSWLNMTGRYNTNRKLTINGDSTTQTIFNSYQTTFKFPSVPLDKLISAVKNTSIDMTFNYQDNETLEKNRSISRNPSLQMAMGFGRSFRTSLTLGYKQDDVTTYTVGTTDVTKEYNAKLRLSDKVELPAEFKLPFQTTVIKTQNRLNWETSLAAKFKSGTSSGNQIDQTQYDLNLQVNYDLIKNINARFSIAASNFQDKIQEGKDYTSLEFSGEVIMKF